MSDISIVIPVHQSDLSQLDKTLASLKEQKDVAFEVLVVINPAPKNEVILGPYPFPVKIFHTDLGVNRARNKGYAHANNPILFYLDSDCILSDNQHLAKMLGLLISNPSLSAVGGTYSLGTQSDVYSKAYNIIQTRWLYAGITNGDYETQYLIGGNFMIKKSSIQISFDEQIIFGGSELCFFLSHFNLGKKFLFKPGLSVTHISILTKNKLIQKAKAQAYGLLYIEKKGLKKNDYYVQVADCNKDPLIQNAVNLYQRIFSNILLKKNYVTIFKNFFLNTYYRLWDFFEVILLIEDQSRKGRTKL